MRTKTRKLKLKTETLRALNPQTLVRAGGGLRTDTELPTAKSCESCVVLSCHIICELK